MYCNQCGKAIPAGSRVCPYCAHPVGQGAMMGTGMGTVVTGRRIDNIFTALTRERTPGAIMEFSLWCTVCVTFLLSFLAAILMEGGSGTSGFRALWIFFMIFQAGLGVMMAFRLKPISLYYCGAIFLFIMVIFFYAVNASVIGRAFSDGVSAINIIFFILALLAGIGLVVCSSIHFFSRINLGKVCAILSIVSVGLCFFLILFLFLIPCGGDYDYIEDVVSNVQEGLNKYCAYWIGSVSYLLTLAVTAVFYSMFFIGFIDSTKDKIYVGTQQAVSAGFVPGLVCIQGAYAGRTVYLQGIEIVIGSQEGCQIQIQDPYVSHRHCSIRFNPTSGYYEVYDASSNGVFLAGGARLQKGAYTACKRGTILCMGSTAQQFRLL